MRSFMWTDMATVNQANRQRKLPGVSELPGVSKLPGVTYPAAYAAGSPHPSRRAFLRDAFCGIGRLALASLLHEDSARAADTLAPKPPHHAEGKAKAVIFLFMAGGPSH